MLLAIDVGNSNNVIGLFSRGKLLTHWRIRTERTRTSDEYWVLIKEFILLNDVEVEIIDEIVIACVVPPLIPILKDMHILGTNFLMLAHKKIGLRLKISEVKRVGPLLSLSILLLP